MFMDDKRIKKFAGGWHGKRVNVSVPFSDEAVNFLEDLSEEIRNDPETAAVEDFAAFGFWCRKKQLEAWKKEYRDRNQRLGWGLILHIAPSNIPALSAYSMALGLLAGNGNLIRVSRWTEKEAAPLYQVIERVMSRPEHQKLYEENLIFTCSHEKEITKACSDQCDGRIVWGGDDSVREIGKIPMRPGCPVLEFPDRYSIGIFDSRWMRNRKEEERNELAQRFYNDTYHVDQNACSSPKMLFWLGNEEAGIEAWWEAVSAAAEKYQLDSWKVSRKYEKICFDIMEKEEIREIRRKNNRLYVADLQECRQELDTYDGRFGTFYQYKAGSLEEIMPWIGRKVQTIVCAGIDPEEIRNEIIRTGVRGGDRIVQVGQALTMGLVWDGKDMIRNLSRQMTAM